MQPNWPVENILLTVKKKKLSLINLINICYLLIFKIFLLFFNMATFLGSTGRLLAIYCIFLTYLLLWTPSFALDMLHNYCCTMDWVEKERAKVIVDNLFHFKTCLNAVFLYIYDEQFKRVFNATIRFPGISEDFLCSSICRYIPLYAIRKLVLSMLWHALNSP